MKKLKIFLFIFFFFFFNLKAELSNFEKGKNFLKKKNMI